MNAARAHAQGMLRMLHPSQPTANHAWTAIGLGGVGLLVASRGLFAEDVGGRLFAALWLVFAATGQARLRQACWSIGRTDAAPLPIGRFTARAVEYGVYLVIITALALVPVAIFGRWADALTLPMLDGAPPALQALGGAFGALAITVLLLAPLTAATATGEIRHGPAALLRILLPWMPVGIAAPAGMLESWAGLGMTVLSSSVITAVLLALRSTGWEDWQLSFPRLSRSTAAVRTALPPLARLATDFREGLGRGIGWGLALTAVAWLPLYATIHGWLPQGVLVFALLLLPASFLFVTQTALCVPLMARMSSTKPPPLPWRMLPLPTGDWQRRTYAHQATGLLVVTMANCAALAATYLGLDLAADPTVPNVTLTTVEFVLPMMLVIMPAAVAWEGRFPNSPRPPPPVALVAFLILGVSCFWLVMALGSEGLAGLDVEQGHLTAVRAAQRLGTAVGPGLLVGAAWLATGWILVTRDIAAQRQA